MSILFHKIESQQLSLFHIPILLIKVPVIVYTDFSCKYLSAILVLSLKATVSRSCVLRLLS